MSWQHALLEAGEVAGIIALAVAILSILGRLRFQGKLLGRIPELVAQLGMRENARVDELLVGQVVILKRLEEIERRLPNGSG